jgi:predicted small lipoprotein YifL
MRFIRAFLVLTMAVTSLTACGSTQPAYQTAAWDSMAYSDSTNVDMDFANMRPLAGSLR